MKCECNLKEFCKRYPVFKTSFSNFLTDPDYIAKFKVDKNNNLLYLEIGYKDDKWHIDDYYKD